MSKTVTLTDPDAPATRQQTFYIFTLTKTDVRPLNLTRSQASAMIAAELAKKEIDPEAKQKSYEAIIKEATAAANRAGAEWMANAKPKFNVIDNGRVVGTMLDVCGIVYLKITEKRTAFAKWVKKTSPHGYNTFVTIPHSYRMRQEMGLGEACEGAALKVLEANGINGVRLYSNID